MRTLLLTGILLLTVGCSTFNSEHFKAEGAKGYALCISGNGPPLTGAGHIASAKVDQDFKGTIAIGPDCSVVITSE